MFFDDPDIPTERIYDMLTSKQRSALKGAAQTEDTIFQVGKGGINDNMIEQISDALKARELVKIKVLDNSMVSAQEAAAELSERTRSEVVQVIGSKVVLFKRNPQDPQIDLATGKKAVKHDPKGIGRGTDKQKPKRKKRN